MGYWSRASADALFNTLPHFKGKTKISIASKLLRTLIIYAIASLVIWFVLGANQVIEEGTIVLAFGLGVIAVIMGTFLWNLVLAPSRMEKVQEDKHQKQIDELANDLCQKGQHLAEIEERLRPKLAIFIEHIPKLGGMVLQGQQQSTFWRLGVVNTSLSPIERCYSAIKDCYTIHSSGKRFVPEGTWPSQGNLLPWGSQYAEDDKYFEITLASEQPAFIDYIMLPYDNSGILCVPSRPKPHNARPDYKSYLIGFDDLEFTIVVGSKKEAMKPSIIKFTFEWKGGGNAVITEIENTSPPIPDILNYHIE